MKTIALLIALTLCISVSAEDNSVPTFKTTSAEIGAEKRKFRRSKDDMLFLLMVDQQGKVVKVKKLASKLDSKRNELKVKRAMYEVLYKPTRDAESPYREMFLSYKVKRVSRKGKVYEAYTPEEFEIDEIVPR